MKKNLSITVFISLCLVIGLGWWLSIGKQNKSMVESQKNVQNNIEQNIVSGSAIKSKLIIKEEENDIQSNVVILGDKEYLVSKVGDKVANLEVVDIGRPKGGVYMRFDGSIQVRGRYYINGDDGEGMDALFNGLICISNIDEASSKQLPKYKDDDREMSFCFENVDRAKELFVGMQQSGSVTVQISSFSNVMMATEAFNTAVLEKIVK